jgi:glycerol-3-phosphate cytidylyltransferase
MRVLTYGTFDLFHWGHVELLRRARELGTQLYVGVSTDEFNAEKGKASVFPFEQRMHIIRSCRYVDFAFPESSWSQKLDDIRNLCIDVFVMGSDWEGKFDFLNENCQVVYLDRTPEISSTLVRHSVYNIGRR